MNRAAISAWVLLSLVYAYHVHAQDYQRIAPKNIPSKKKALQLPENQPPSSDNGHNDSVLVPQLKGLVFVGAADLVKKQGISELKGIETNNIELLRTTEFQSIAEKYIGQPVTLKKLDDLVREIVVYYRDHDRPVVYVVVPEQDITTGVIQVLVLEGRVGEIRAEGNKWFRSSIIIEGISSLPSEVVSAEKLKSDLTWINANPFRQVDLVYTQGKSPGSTDLILRTKDRFPVRVYTGFEDTGNALTDDDRYIAGFNWGDAFWLDHQLGYQFTSDYGFEKLLAHSGNYLAPLPWRHKLNIFGSYAQSKADLPAPFNLKGTSWQASARYIIPFKGAGNYRHEGAFGFDFKQSNNNLDFGGAQVFNSMTDVAQFVFNYNGGLPDRLGVTSFDITGFYSPGDLSDNNTDIDFTASRAGANDDYAYMRAIVDRLTRLPYDFSLANRFTVQTSDSNLLGSEQLGLGGVSSVRGYDEREGNTDTGFISNLEIRSPAIGFGKIFNAPEFQDQLQFLFFWDFATGYNKNLIPGEDPHVTLASVGPGLRYQISSYLSLRADYGFQLYDTGNNRRYNDRWHVGVVVSY